MPKLLVCINGDGLIPIIPGSELYVVIGSGKVIGC